MKVCPNCHHEIKEDEFALRCPECGYSLDPIDQNSNDKLFDSTSAFILVLLFIPHLIELFFEMAKSESKVKRVIFYTVIFTLLFCVAFLLIFFLLIYKK